MLERLRINNFVLIPTLDLDLYDGMSVITGETGSGKSIVLGALSLILGAKADKEEIRAGEDKAEIEAVYGAGIDLVLSSTTRPMPVEEAIKQAPSLIKAAGYTALKAYLLGR